MGEGARSGSACGCCCCCVTICPAGCKGSAPVLGAVECPGKGAGTPPAAAGCCSGATAPGRAACGSPCLRAGAGWAAPGCPAPAAAGAAAGTALLAARTAAPGLRWLRYRTSPGGKMRLSRPRAGEYSSAQRATSSLLSAACPPACVGLSALSRCVKNAPSAPAGQAAHAR